MSSGFSLFRNWCIAVTLAVSAEACGATNASFAIPTATPGHVPVYSPPPADSPKVMPSTTSPSATSTISPVPVERVVVMATKGNIFIRRGPDLAYNPLSVLRAGQSEPALARDVLAEWVQIHLPDQPERTGWISLQSHYTNVTGNVMGLPEIEPTDWPVLASFRNCTNHQMLIYPGGIILPSVANFPANDVLVNPGTYVIRDTDFASYPVVLTVDVREGSTIEVRTDGNGERRKCPVP